MSGPGPRWLNAAEQRAWRTCLSGVATLQAAMDADLHRFGIDLAEYEILVQLDEAPERRLRMSQLAAQVQQSRSRLTHTIARMQRAGLVTRAACPDDRRGVLAELSDRGHQLLVDAAPHHVETVRRMLIDRISADDLEALGRIFSAVIEAAEDPEESPEANQPGAANPWTSRATEH